MDTYVMLPDMPALSLRLAASRSSVRTHTIDRVGAREADGWSVAQRLLAAALDP